jgi:hypothetical protein
MPLPGPPQATPHGMGSSFQQQQQQNGGYQAAPGVPPPRPPALPPPPQQQGVGGKRHRQDDDLAELLEAKTVKNRCLGGEVYPGVVRLARFHTKGKYACRVCCCKAPANCSLGLHPLLL